MWRKFWQFLESVKKLSIPPMTLWAPNRRRNGRNKTTQTLAASIIHVSQDLVILINQAFSSGLPDGLF
jgi:hypothetical protein